MHHPDSDTRVSIHRARREMVVFFYVVIELDVVVQANKRERESFLSMDLVDDVIDHLFW